MREREREEQKMEERESSSIAKESSPPFAIN
jgi:hypothetical protein